MSARWKPCFWPTNRKASVRSCETRFYGVYARYLCRRQKGAERPCRRGKSGIPSSLTWTIWPSNFWDDDRQVVELVARKRYGEAPRWEICVQQVPEMAEENIMPLVICAYEHCGRMFERGPRPRRFCCEACRRSYQNEVRREARAEARAVREAGQPMTDPWTRCDVDDWTAEEIWKNALLDPLPAGSGEAAVAGPMAEQNPHACGDSALPRRPSPACPPPRPFAVRNKKLFVSSVFFPHLCRVLCGRYAS